MDVKKLAGTVAVIVLIGAAVAWIIGDGFLTGAIQDVWEAIWGWIQDFFE